MSYWYPRLNRRGDLASGNGEIWCNGSPLPTRVEGHSPQWSGDPEDAFVFIGDEARIIDTRTGAVVGQPGYIFNPRVGNTSGISAGCGHWCGWNVQQGLIYDGICIDAGAAPGAIDQSTGALYYLTPYQADHKNVVLDGRIVRAGVIATELVAGDRCATWGEYEGTRTLYGWCEELGVARLSPLAASEYLFVGIPVRTPDGLWLVTQTHAGLIVYPWAGSSGYVLEGDFYYHHAMFLNGVIAIVATNAMGGLVRVDQSLEAPRRDLTQYRPSTGTPDAVVPIGKPCWLGWFEFTDSLTYIPPSNCNLWIKQGGPIKDAAGAQFAYWVQGGSVEEIESQIAGCAWPCVAYWDARTWPRWPALRPGDWLALQWYCLKDETPEHFEQNMAAVLATVPATYAQVCGVCQCYDTNTGLTSNLAGLVPVYARLARDYPQVTMLLSFTDQGRSDPATGAGGLEQHPDCLPYWQQLHAGITGTPAAPIPPEPIEPEADMDHDAMNTFAIDWWNTNQIRQRSIDMGGNANVPGTDKSYCLPLQQWAFRRIMTEAYFVQGFSWALMFWKAGFINSGNSEDLIQHKLHSVGEDAYCYLTSSSSSAWKDAVGSMGTVDASLNFLPPFYESAPGDWANCGPAPSLEFMIEHDPPPDGIVPPDPNPKPPEPGAIELRFQDPVPTSAKRSDPRGLTVYWDMDSPNPIAWFELGLVGTPEVFRLQVLEPYPPDGRYFRGLAWKVTQNGAYTLRLTVRDVHGNEQTIDGPAVYVSE